MKLVFAIVIILSLCSTSQAFDIVKYDPWYFQTNSSVTFWVPDKAQHFYGSQLLVEGGLNPVTALGAGFLYELWQERNGIGFSWRDLVADGLGVIAGEFNTGKAYILVDYSVEQKTIILKGIFRL